MTNSTENRTDRETARQAQVKARRRAEQAQIVEGLRAILDPEEQLLGFARGRLAGGWRGKLLVGPEAFFAPFVNIGLTERRFVLQHIHPESGRPSEILPHFFPLSEITALVFTDIETFGAEPACHLILRLGSEQHFRLRLEGATNFENARTMAEVFQSLMSAHRAGPRPTQSVCASCGHVLDQPSKFCPYCGQRRADSASEPQSEAAPVPTEAAATPPQSQPEPEAGTASSVEADVRTHPLDTLTDFATPEAPVESAPPTPEPPQETPAPPDFAPVAPEPALAPAGWIETPAPEAREPSAFTAAPASPVADEISPETDRHEEPTSERLSDALAEPSSAESAHDGPPSAPEETTPHAVEPAHDAAPPETPHPNDTIHGEATPLGEE